MPRIAPLGTAEDGSTVARVMARRPEILAAWQDLTSTVRFTGLLPAELKEAVRAATASEVGCAFCASIGDAPPERPDVRTSLAVAFAQQVVADNRSVDARTLDLLREEFTDDEIVELLVHVSVVCIGGQTFGNLIGAEAATEEEAAAYARRRAERIARAAGG